MKRWLAAVVGAALFVGGNSLVASAGQLVANSPAEFRSALYHNLVERNPSFEIRYGGAYQDVYDGAIQDMFAPTWEADDPNTSDDFDYLAWNLAQYAFSVPEYTDKEALFQFDVTYRENKGQLARVNQTVKQVLPRLIGEDDLATIKNIHDYVVSQIEYDRSMTRYTAYEGMIENSTVCQGYALLTYKLLTEAGIEARFVSGYAGEAHGWNIVKVGDLWYFLDTTWDDPISDQPVVSYDYFLVGQQTLAKDHTLDAKYKTPEFRAAYPISENDYDVDAKIAIAAENTSEQEAILKIKREFCQELAGIFDDSFGYAKASAMEKTIYDLYKKIVISTVSEMSAEAFTTLVNEPKIFDKIVDVSHAKIDARVYQPITAYLDSEAYHAEVERRTMDELKKTDLEHMSEKQAGRLAEDAAERHAEAVFMEYFNEVAQQNVRSIIDEMKQVLQ